MQLIYHCPACQTLNIASASTQEPEVKCASCDWKRVLNADFIEGDKPLKCLACGNHDLWRQKDFPQGLGLLLVGTGATLSTIFWANVQPVMAIGVLMVFAAIDLALYVFMPDVLVCYRCKARHRKADMNEEHPRFNLELAERYRQEAIRLAEAEKAQR
jgi:DNA-directed RNA polymerase subunit RPC12/RpoP